MPTNALLILTTLGSAADARALVNGLVEEVVLLKTDASKWDALAAAVEERHPYDVPELLVVSVDRGAAPYLSWLSNEVVA